MWGAWSVVLLSGLLVLLLVGCLSATEFNFSAVNKGFEVSLSACRPVTTLGHCAGGQRRKVFARPWHVVNCLPLHTAAPTKASSSVSVEDVP